MSKSPVVIRKDSVHTVPFHSHDLFLVEYDGQPFVPMRPVIEGMGLDWKSQYAKLHNNRKRWATVVINTTVAGDGKSRKMVSMPLKKFPGFICSIQPAKVKTSLRSTVVQFQNECDDVLWEHWEKKIKPSAATPTKPQLPPPAPTLTPEQQHAIKAAVASIAQESYLEIRKAYSRTWNDLKDYFRVARYQDIPESRFVEAMRFLGAPLPDDSVLPAKKPLPSENNLEAMALKGVLSVAKMAKDHKDDLYLAHSNAKDAVFKAVKELEDTMTRLNNEYSKIHDVLEHLPLYARGLVTEK